MEYLKDIISDIKKENCVLILGPDIVDFGDKSFFEKMCDDIVTNTNYKNVIDTTPQYIFANEELLQLMPNAKETTLLRMMEEFYSKQTSFNEPLTKISQLPFNLVISLMPDDRLKRIFEDQKFAYSYAYYPKEGPHKQVEKPLKEKPLIYNLLGDFNELDAIITFDHLFSFLSGIMGKRELPQVIQETLKKARTFIFLGVHFEKWYIQLLLRIITSTDKKDKYIILKNQSNNDVCTFIARRLELDFLSTEPLNFLEVLYDECKKLELLKTVNKKTKIKIFLSYSHIDKQAAVSIRNYLSENDFEVIMDDVSMKGGEKIENFITKINDVDIFIPLLSENSLLSPWVSKEIITTLNLTEKYLMPCYIDETFLDANFETTAKDIVTTKVKSLNELIIKRGISSTEDLDNEKRSWIDYYGNLPKMLRELNSRKCMPLSMASFELHMQNLIKDIKSITLPKWKI